MGILVPKGSSVADQLTKQLKDAKEKEIYLDFIERFVLDKDKSNSKKIAEMFMRARDRKKGLTDVDQVELAENYRKVADEILETIGDKKAEIATFTFSRGGSRTSLEKSQLESLKSKGANVEYTTIVIDGVIMLEPIGQADNATYIMDTRGDKGKDILTDNLEKIKSLTRTEAISKGLMLKITHDKSNKEGYDFEAKHISKVLSLAMNDPDQFLSVVKSNNGCGLKKIASLLPGTTSEILKNVQKGVEHYGLESEVKDFMSGEVQEAQRQQAQKHDNGDQSQQKPSIGEE